MVAAIEAGEEMPAGDDSALIDALAPGAEGAAAPVAATAAEGQRQGVRRAAHHPPVGRAARPGDEHASPTWCWRATSSPAACANRRPTSPVDGAFERLSAIIAEMRDAITRTRMQRIENLFVGLPRMVRDLSAELGKQVLVDIEGGDVELDREMIEMIRDPLTHIIRNAVDHGIETPAERLKAGKREIGMLSRLGAPVGQPDPDRHPRRRPRHRRQEAGREGDRRRRRSSKAAAAQLSPREQLALIFEAGLSTAKEVTAISGRGVGMDVVRSNVERIGGIVEVDSKPGEGTRMTLRVPLTLTIIPALTVSIGEPAFRHSALGDRGDRPRQRRVSVTLEQHRRRRGRDHPRPPRARSRRSPTSSASTATIADEDRTLIVLRPAGGDVYALAVDRIHDHEELVVKPAAPAVMATGLYAGTTLADDGSPILLFDPAGPRRGRRRQARGAGARGADRRRRRPPPTRKRLPVLLFRGLDGGAPGASPRRSSTGSRKSPADAIKRGRRPASGPARRSDPAAGRRRAPPSSATARSACSASTTAPRDRLCLPRGHRLRDHRP